MPDNAFAKEKVYDVLLRLMHATLGLSILGLAATGWGSELFEDNPADEKTVWQIHFLMGRVLAVTLALRVVWGLVGPQHARWKDMWHPRAWMDVLRRKWPAPGRFGHDVMASAAYLAVYAVTAMMVATGLAQEGLEQGTGPFASLFDRVGLGELFEEPHEVGAALCMGFVVLHLGAMLWHQFHGGRPVLQAMVSGNQYQPVKEV